MAPTPPSPIAVTGVGVVSPIGVGYALFAQGLASATPGLATETLEDGTRVVCGRVRNFEPRQRIPVRTLRRLPWLCQLGLFAAHEACEDAGILDAPARNDIGVIVGTGLGALETTATFLRETLTVGPGQANPALFPSSVMNATAAFIAMELGFRGYSTTVTHKDASALEALVVGTHVVRTGRASRVVCGAVDEVSPATVHGYARFGALSRSLAMRPFDVRRDGIGVGEGAAFFVLEPLEAARQRGARIRALITGVGMASASSGLLGWSRKSGEASRAMMLALGEAGCTPDDVDYVVSGANGTRDLDALECAVVRWVFGRRKVQTGSILGQTGEHHSAACLRVASAVAALELQRLPGTVGLETPDPLCEGLEIVTVPRDAKVTRALVPSHATGGAEVAVLLERADGKG